MKAAHPTRQAIPPVFEILTGQNLECSRIRASVFEFTHRDIIIRLIYLMAVLCYLFDPAMVGSVLAERLATQFSVLAETAKHAVLFAGAGLVGLAALIRTWATAYLRYDVMRNPRIHTDRLIREGPFGYLRNPLYLGNLLMVAGVSLYMSRSGLVVLVAGSLLFIHRLIGREESELARTHGESFRDYCRVVPRWVPSLKPRRATTGHIPSFKNGVVGELLLWIIALALAVYAATFDLRLFEIIFVCAFVPGAGRRIFRMGRRRAA
jgi:protein-S-isoprenylcysteine O-methyltransferase Ste14